MGRKKGIHVSHRLPRELHAPHGSGLPLPLRHRRRHSFGTRFLASSVTVFSCTRSAGASAPLGLSRRERTSSKSDVTFVTIFETDAKCSLRRSQNVCNTHSIVLSIHTVELYWSFCCIIIQKHSVRAKHTHTHTHTRTCRQEDARTHRHHRTNSSRVSADTIVARRVHVGRTRQRRERRKKV